ncbi:putative flavoprotein [Gongronella butleri]|nr:putative flavoprotein [Gongronella butleri]
MSASPTVLVIGAGFSGICSAIQLKKQLGIVPDIVEAASEVSGTWHANTYPGAQCDIPSHLYSLSFELNPNWSAFFSPQAEIYDYLKAVATKHDLYSHLQLNTVVQHAEWDNGLHMWKVVIQPQNEAAYTRYYHYIFSGVGGLRIPKIPAQFKGFTGQVVHTARWDSSIDFNGKRVVVIGNGASAVQVLPQLQKQASHIYNFQRTPTWVSPRMQYTYSGLVKFCFRWVPFAMRLYRWYQYWIREFRFRMIKNPTGPFARTVRDLFTKSIKHRLTQGGRPDLIPVLLPEYTIGCKRITQSENFYEALCSRNVTVIPHAAEKAEGNTVTGVNGEQIECDILVLATGFEVHNQFGNLHVIGRDGESLKEKWGKNLPVTYKTVCIPNYPNFFMMLGPGSGLGHNSVVSVIENQVDYAVQCVKTAQKKRLAYIEPKAEAAEQFTKALHASLKGTAWLSGCESWYLRDGVPASVWGGTVTSFWWMLKRFNFQDYHHVKPKAA